MMQVTTHSGYEVVSLDENLLPCDETEINAQFTQGVLDFPDKQFLLDVTNPEEKCVLILHEQQIYVPLHDAQFWLEPNEGYTDVGQVCDAHMWDYSEAIRELEFCDLHLKIDRLLFTVEMAAFYARHDLLVPDCIVEW